MTTEELIREIISKICPFHGEHAIANLHEGGQIEISACCQEFRKSLENFIRNNIQKGIDEPGDPDMVIN